MNLTQLGLILGVLGLATWAAVRLVGPFASAAADRLRHLFRRPDVHIGNDDSRTLARQSLRGRCANPTTPAGHQGNAVLEPHFVWVSNAAPPSLRGSDAPER